MNRAEMVEQAAEALCAHVIQNAAEDLNYQPEEFRDEARAVLDAILPQVTTVEELEALPVAALLKGADGDVWQVSGFGGFDCLSEDGSAGGYLAAAVITRSTPLTVVWRP